MSRRTILRDVDALSQLGVPVVALPGPGGGYALPDGYWLAPLHLTSAEATVLLLGLQGLGDGSGGALGPARQGAEEKILAALRPGVRDEAERELTANLRSVPPMRQPRPEDIETLRRAIGRRGWVGADYRSLRRQSHHVLLPLRLWLADGRWFCAAISRRTRGELTFRVERMEAVTSIAPPPDAAAVIAAASAPRAAYDDPRHPEVRLSLTYRGVRLAEDHPDFADRLERNEQGGGAVRFRCPPSELPFYAGEIMKFGPDAAVQGPPELLKMVRELSRDLAHHHEDAAER